MRIIDITRTVQDAPVYPGSPELEVVKLRDVAEGDAYNSSLITAESHMGTHADAFNHFPAENDLSVDEMPLENYCGPCRVISVPADGLITLDDIRGKIDGAERIVLHGGGQAFLCEEAAEYIASCRVKLLVTDALSVAPHDNEASIHVTLFRAGVAVVENAVLDEVEDGEYLIFAFPVKYAGCDGAPVRAVLISK